MLVATPPAHQGLFERGDELDRRGECVHGTCKEGAGRKRRYFEYRSAAHGPLTQAGTVRGTVGERWDRPQEGPVRSPNSGVPDFAVPREPAATLSGSGRSRCKSATEQFTVPKKHGADLEHNYGHGQHTPSRVFALLTLLAVLAQKGLEFGDRL